ncbi:MAG: DUF1653 domain-containing protein [Symbiobacteriaceae bacterium]|nr:DUF1653 domain-containing protein [Symbiobacteriaceae bacterium]
MEKHPKPGIYRHYKGRLYCLVGLAQHSETLELMAVYHSQDNLDDLWVRPVSMWNELVEKDGALIPRFSFVSPEN